MELFGTIVLFAGFYNKMRCHKIAIENLSKFGVHGDTIFKSFTIDQKTHMFKTIEIHEPKIETDSPIYVGSQHVKIPIGGGSRIVYKTIYTGAFHNLPDVDTTECSFVDMKYTMKTYEYRDLKEKLKQKYKLSINRLDISATMLRLYTSTNVYELHLLGVCNNGIFIAHYGGTCKDSILNYADRGKNWNVIIAGIFLIVIGLIIRSYSETDDDN